jgi:hypothetical protein
MPFAHTERIYQLVHFCFRNTESGFNANNAGKDKDEDKKAKRIFVVMHCTIG